MPVKRGVARLACPGNGNRTSRVLEVCALETWQTLLIAYPGLTLPLAGSCKVKSDGDQKLARNWIAGVHQLRLTLLYQQQRTGFHPPVSSLPTAHLLRETPKSLALREEGASSGFHVDRSRVALDTSAAPRKALWWDMKRITTPMSTTSMQQRRREPENDEDEEEEDENGKEDNQHLKCLK